MDAWRIIIASGATYEQLITVTGVSDIATATLWRVRIANTTGTLVNATTANGMIVATASPSQKQLVIPAATTAALALGNALYDFEVEWSGGTVVRRYVSNGRVQVNPKAGT